MKKYLTFIILVFFLLLVVYGVPGSSITIGEATYKNPTYKKVVFDYFQSRTDKNIEDVIVEIINASEVNRVSGDVTGRLYTSDDIVSCAMVDLSYYNNIRVVVDESKIESVTPHMYVNALKSVGIEKGYVVVSSPVPSSGEGALIGIMKSYETLVGAQIPEEAKKVAFKELYLETKLVKETGADGEKVAQFFDEAKNKSKSQNLKDPEEIRQVVVDVAGKMGINLRSTHVEEISQNIADSQRVQGSVANFRRKIDEQGPMQLTIQTQVYSWLQSFYGYLKGLLSA